MVGGNFKGLMDRFIETFPNVEDQLTEKQIRSYFSRLRAKIKSGINEARSQDIINEKVRNEVIQELQKIQKKMTGSNEIESEENLQPSTTTRRRPARRQRNRKRPQTTTRRVRRVKRVRRRPKRRLRRRPKDRSRRRPSGKTTRRRKIAIRMRRVNPWNRRERWEGRGDEIRSRSRSPNETS